ncbi:MAG: type II toxin-antitoxin system HicB family antitoxin [Acidobacteriaceae bacterium]|jgi:predicted RNase H-like HicB family nuclease
MSKYIVIYERSATGWGAYVPDLPGLGVVGDTLEETKQLIREGIDFHIEGLRKDGDPVPPPSTFIEEVEVKIPA